MILDLSNDLDKKKFREYGNKLFSEGRKVEIKELKGKRTIKQNSYLHICITLYAIHFGEILEDAKSDLKQNCPFMICKRNGQERTKRTRDLDTKELTDFIEWIRNYAGQNGCYIPTSEEYLTNYNQIEKEIQIHKPYL